MWVRRIMRLLPQLKKMLLGAALFALVIEILKLGPPYLMKVVIDLLVAPNPVLGEVLFVIGGVLIVSLVTTAIEDRFILYTATNIFRVETSILRQGHNKLLFLGLRYHESHPSGDLVHLMNKGSSRLAELMWFIQDQFMGAALQILLTSALLMYVHFWCGVVFVFFMPVVLFLVHRTGKKVQPYRKEYHDKFREATWEMNQSLLNVRTVKDYVQEARERKKYDRLLEEYLKLADIRIRVENRDTRNRDIVLGIARFAVLFYAVYLVFTGEMTAGTLFLFATLSEKVVASLYRLGRLYSHLGDSMEAINQFSDLFEEQEDIVDKPTSIDVPKLEGKLSFDQVTFSYADDVPVLEDINLEIPPKSVVAFVGRSGAGKTTMIKLLGRHYDVTSGSIKIDGLDIRDMKVEDYRRKIAVVSQDIEVFDASVSQNIAYGTKATQEQIERAAKAAHAHGFILEMPDGYGTRVGEKGVKLSGGQRQRVGIARALLMEPVVLIFDEATSSLDTESERSIQQALIDISRRQTMIIIAHRFSTIESADMIVVFEDGRVVESGSHSDLMRKDGIFARMRGLQRLGEIRA